jgi:hypothetical protein
LLHPDLQCDRRLKELAECQMKRLGDVVATLEDPRKRAAYDAGLAKDASATGFQLPPDEGPSLWNAVVRYWFWSLTGATTIGMMLWYGLSSGADLPLRVPAPVVSATGDREKAAPTVTRRLPAPRENPRTGIAKTVRARAAEQSLPMALPPPLDPSAGAALKAPAAPPSTTARAELPVLAVPRGVRSVEMAQGADVPRFVGQWLYTAGSGKDDTAGTYPATYVEFRLREAQGSLEGEYRAVHSNLDKAISPEVLLHVRGELPVSNTGMLAWESGAGAKGELELTLQVPNRLLVKWWTTQFGRQEALTSGMARLTLLRNP